MRNTPSAVNRLPKPSTKTARPRNARIRKYACTNSVRTGTAVMAEGAARTTSTGATRRSETAITKSRIAGLCPDSGGPTSSIQAGRRPFAAVHAILFRPYEIDQRRHADVAAALLQRAVVLVDLERGEIRELRVQQSARIELRDVLGPARRIGQLFGPVGLHEQQSARLERLLHAGEEARPLFCRRELNEDRDSHVELSLRPTPVEDVGLLVPEGHATRLCELVRFRDRDRGEIDRKHVETLFSEEDAVAAFAVRDRERGLSLAQPMRLALEKRIRLGAEHIAGRGKAFVPMGKLGHGSSDGQGTTAPI